MDTPYAFATLVTSDHYLPGALAVAAALKELHSASPVQPEVSFQTVCLVTPETVDVSSIKLLRRAFDIVIGVEVIEQEDGKGLQLLGRPDLSHVLTKLHVFRLTQYSKIIFLDADVLPIRPLSHLFTIPHEFAAVPDVGWPDIFNSGVMVLTPGEDKFKELTELLKTKGTWDGGDQGLLNEWRGGNWHRLSFTYNTTPTAAYTYAPAYERFGSEISAIHFIGPNKPWVSITYRAPGTKYGQSSNKSPDSKAPAYDYDSLVDRWYDVYDRNYRSEESPEQANFEFTRYDSAWDSGTGSGFGAELARPASGPAPGGALGLDDLRKIAVEGINSYNASAQQSQQRPKVGEYRSMPLEGRVDLMRPRKEPQPKLEEEKSKQGASQDQGGDQNLTPKQGYIALAGDEVPRMETLPTPLPSEVPGAPHHAPLSLPPSEGSTPYEYPQPGQAHSFYQQHAYQPQRDDSEWQDSDFQQRQYEQSGSYFQAGGGVQSQLSMMPGHWSPQGDRRFWSQTARQHAQESEQSDDQGPWQPSWKAQEPHRPGVTSPQGERPPHAPWHHHSRPQGESQFHPVAGHHHHVHHRESQRQSGQQSPSVVAHQHPSGRHGHQSPRGHHSPRGVHSPRGHHSPPHARSSPPLHQSGPHNPRQPRLNLHHHHQSQPQHPHQPLARHPHQHHDQPNPRSPSPPKMSWNPAVEPPPKTPPPVSAFPADTYFPNVWDQVPSQGHDATHQSFPDASGPQTEVFFNPPPPAQIPEQLLREGQYAGVIGRPVESPGSPPVPPTPDRNKVHAIFPWEEKPRPAPRRVFPASDNPPPVAKFIDEPPPRKPLPRQERVGSQGHTLSPPISLPFNIAYANAWDTVPSIQRYATKLVRPHHPVHQPPPPEYDEGWRRWDEERERVYQEKQDASSMDGDDEDEGDDDDDNRGPASRWDSESSRERGQTRGSRSSSFSSTTSLKGKKYRARAIQTERVETRSMGVQVNVWAEEVAAAAEKGQEPKPSRGTGMATRAWPQLPSGVGLLPPVTMRDFKRDPDQMGVSTPTVTQPPLGVLPYRSTGSPTGLRSPHTLGSPRTYSPPKVTSPLRIPSPPKIASPKAVTPPKVPSPKGPPSPRATMSPRRLSAAQMPTSRLAGSPKSGSPRPGSPAVGPSASSSPRQSPKLTRLTSPFSPPLQRTSSNDTAIASSPSTQGPVETPENTPVVGPIRKGGRVWDPARGVDVFKRSSEEVLARFLRSGSFEEEEAQRRHV